MNKKILTKLNSSKPFGFIKDIEEKTVLINEKETTIFEFILEIPIDNQLYNKLVFVRGSEGERFKTYMRNGLCIYLQGKHIPCPYETERSQYLTELGILEIVTFDWELNLKNHAKTKSQYFEDLRRDKFTKKKRQHKKVKMREFKCDRFYFN